MVAERDRLRQEESERVIARDRQRAEREEREAREELERWVAERNRKPGWG
jgi:hypothetical protein